MFCLVFLKLISVLVVRGVIWRGATAPRNTALRTPKIIYQRAVRSVFRHLAYSGTKLLLTISSSKSTYYSRQTCVQSSIVLCAWCLKCYLVYTIGYSPNLICNMQLCHAPQPEVVSDPAQCRTLLAYGMRATPAVSLLLLCWFRILQKMCSCSFLPPVAACFFVTSKVSRPLVLSRVYDASCDYNLFLSSMLLILASLLLLRLRCCCCCCCG